MSQFVDECQLNVRAGDGGAGCVAFRREGPVAMGGPLFGLALLGTVLAVRRANRASAGA